uniref:Uncharacterized protein n=1 Tax=Planktothricoides sp. SpSt-374 TaxID=2282167 RepID=A0A7C4A0P2_9CYAN
MAISSLAMRSTKSLEFHASGVVVAKPPGVVHPSKGRARAVSWLLSLCCSKAAMLMWLGKFTVSQPSSSPRWGDDGSIGSGTGDVASADADADGLVGRSASLIGVIHLSCHWSLVIGH